MKLGSGLVWRTWISLLDLAGRVYKNKPAPTNLIVPPCKFAGDQKMIIGEDTKAA